MSVSTFTESFFLSLVSVSVTIASVVLAYVFYRRSRREKGPTHVIAQRTIIENKRPLLRGLSVHFIGVEQELITVANIAFWNRGAETILHSDIAEGKPLGVILGEGSNLLDARILKTSDSANQCRLGEPRTEADGRVVIPIDFDYLDRNEGMLIQLVHNGSRTHEVALVGKIKGARDLGQESDVIFSCWPSAVFSRIALSPRAMLKLAGGIVVALCTIMGISSLVIGFVQRTAWPGVVVGIILLLAAYAYFSMFLRSLVPRELQSDL